MLLKDKKPLRLLGKMGETQLERLGLFLKSDYFSPTPQPYLLFQYLLSFYPLFDSPECNEENVYQFVFPDKDDNPKRLINLFSRFQQLLEEFIVIEEQRTLFKQSKPELVKPLLHFYREKRLPDLQKSELNRLQKKLAKSKYVNYTFLYDSYIYEQELAQYLNSYDARKGDINAQNMSDRFDEFYLARKLILFCVKIGRTHFLKIDYSIPRLQEVLDYIEKGNFESILAVRVWKLALSLLLFPAEERHYRKLKEALFEHHKEFPHLEVATLFSYLMNATKNLFSPKLEFYSELHQLHKFQVKEQLHIYNSYVIPSFFKNAVTVSLKLGEIEWAESFIEDNEALLFPNLREDVYRFNKAEVAFYKKEYEMVLELHQQIEYKDLFYLIGSKRTLAKTYYELGEMDLLDSHLNAFRVFIFRQKEKISDSDLKCNQNFINFLFKIVAILPKEDKKINRNIKRVNAATDLWEQSWLVEKLEEKL